MSNNLSKIPLYPKHLLKISSKYLFASKGRNISTEGAIIIQEGGESSSLIPYSLLTDWFNLESVKCKMWKF